MLTLQWSRESRSWICIHFPAHFNFVDRWTSVRANMLTVPLSSHLIPRGRRPSPTRMGS